MNRTRVKICGVTNPDDALHAASAGADAIGMVFHPGAKRGVTLEQAKGVVERLPPMVTPIGLFLDRDPLEIAAVSRAVGVRTVQLQGMESPQAIDRLRDFQVIKAVRVSPTTLAAVLDIWRHAIATLKLTNLVGIVLDTDTPHGGGSGIENDWAAVRAARSAGALEGLPRLILAGGLRPETVGAVVAEFRPWAVDVSSGVESETPRRKDPQRVEAFIAAVQAADRQS